MPRQLLAVIIFFILLAPAVLQAQDAGEDRSALLPEIDPQDIEIRGDFRARFAGISRQPILGFSPTPRVFRIDPNRMPFMETPEEVVASLPLSDLEPQLGPPRDLREYPDASRLFGYAGLGNFLSPEAQVWFGVPVSQQSRVTGNVNFLSSDGHIEENLLSDFNSDSDFTGAFRRLDGDITYQNRLTTNGALFMNLRGRSDFSQVNDDPFFGPISGRSDARNEINLAGGTIGWVSQSSVYDRFDAYLGYSGTFTKTQYSVFSTIGPDFDPYTSDTSEHLFSAGTSVQWAGNRIGDVLSFEIRGDYALAEINADETRLDETGAPEPVSVTPDADWYLAGAGAYLQRELNSGNRMKFGVRAFGGYDQEQENVFMVYPYLSYEIRGISPFTLKAEVTGKMQNRGLEEAFIANRTLIYTYPSPLVNERVFYGDLQTQYQFTPEFAVQGGLYISYTLRPLMYTSNSWLQPEDLFLVQPSAGFSFNVRPRLLTAYGEAVWNITDMQESAFPNEDGNFSDFTGLEQYRLTAGLRSTPFRNAVFKAWADYIGPRKEIGYGTSQDSMPVIPPDTGLKLQYLDNTGKALLLNIQAEYRMSGSIGFYVKALNLLNQSYEIWNGYEERPLQVFGGITFNF